MNLMAPLLAVGGLALAAASLAAAALVFGVYWVWRRPRDPVERERRRRLRVNAGGRVTDGSIVDVQKLDNDDSSPAKLIFYEYSVRGVDYSTAQDVSALDETAEGGFARCLGAVHVKYQVRNPSNSIVICEDWSGLLTPAEDSVETSQRTSTEAF